LAWATRMQQRYARMNGALVIAVLVPLVVVCAIILLLHDFLAGEITYRLFSGAKFWKRAYTKGSMKTRRPGCSLPGRQPQAHNLEAYEDYALRENTCSIVPQPWCPLLPSLPSRHEKTRRDPPTIDRSVVGRLLLPWTASCLSCFRDLEIG